MSATQLEAVISVLDRLVAFDTESTKSNLALVEWVEHYLRARNVSFVRVPNEQGDKAALFATIGPMVDGGACLTALLDCSRGARPLVYIGGNWTDPNDASLPDRVFPDPRDPLNVPAVTCPPLSGGADAATGAPLCMVGGVQAPCPVLRVIYGGTCALWRPNNDAGCHWDNVNQSFLGPRCVASNGTQCMCRHVRAPCVLCPPAAPTGIPCVCPAPRR